MIEVFEGRLGGGKSYTATVRAVDVLRRGGVVATNVELVWLEIVAYVTCVWGLALEEDQLILLSEDQIAQFHKHTPSGTSEMPVLIIVDEAQLYFNARDWNQADRELLAFLTQSRKVDTDIIFISQSAFNIDKQFMRLVQYIWRFRDLEKWKIPGLGVDYATLVRVLTLGLLNGRQILACQFDYDGKTLLQREFVNKDKRIFKLYNTKSLLRTFPRLEGVKTKRDLKKVERKNKMAKFLIPVALIVGVLAVISIFKQFGSIGKPAKPVQVVQAPAPPRSVVQASTPKPAIEHRSEPLTSRWTIGKLVVVTTAFAEYRVGGNVREGRVEAVQGEDVRVRLWDGRTLYVHTFQERPQPLATTMPIAENR